jgi:uncharacterized protein (TIGR03083 family)
MNDRREAVRLLKDELDAWERLLAGLTEAQLTAPSLDEGWSIKDVLAHLWWWQQLTVARQEAARRDIEPAYPAWPESLGPDPDENTEQTNDWVYRTYREMPWQDVYSGWRGNYERLLDLVEEVPERDLTEPGKYAWMGGYPLMASLEGTYEHHVEHLEWLTGWLGQNGLLPHA